MQYTTLKKTGIKLLSKYYGILCNYDLITKRFFFNFITLLMSISFPTKINCQDLRKSLKGWVIQFECKNLGLL